jgi:signal transduction histidine kinase
MYRRRLPKPLGLHISQAEAASRMRDLEESLNALQRLENERAALLRETHDLRGNVGVIANASSALVQPETQGRQRDHFYKLLQRQIRSMAGLLTELMELAHLDAAQDPLELTEFDAAACLQDSCWRFDHWRVSEISPCARTALHRSSSRVTRSNSNDFCKICR